MLLTGPRAATRARRRSFRAVLGGFLALITVAASVVLVGCGTQPGCVVSAVGAPTCGRLWGMVLPASGTKLVAAVASTERTTGRPLDIVHTYHRWYDTFPTPTERSLAATGHELFLNWEPVDRAGHPMSWAAIGAGVHDQDIDALAQRLRGLPPLLLSFSHEPELNYGVHGKGAAFVSAFRHIHDRLRADGVTNVRYVWNVMGLSSAVWLDRYPSLWPGSSYVDWIAWDPYNWGSCRPAPWKSFTEIVSPFYHWLEAQGWGDKPFMLAEYGSVENTADPAGKATWLDNVPSSLSAFPNLRALVYFDVGAPPANCDWPITTSAAAASAFDRLARSAAFRVQRSQSADAQPTG